MPLCCTVVWCVVNLSHAILVANLSCHNVYKIVWAQKAKTISSVGEAKPGGEGLNTKCPRNM